MTWAKKALILFIILFLAPTSYGSWAAMALMGLRPGDPAPDFQVTTLDGKEISLTNLKGKTAILAFWKRGQGSSEKTLADLERIYQEYKAKGVIVVAINADNAPEQEIRRIGSAQNLSYPLARDEGLKAYGRFGVMVLPTTLVIGPEGKLEYYRSIHPRDFYAQIRGYVRLLLGEITQAQLEKELYPRKIPEESPARKKAKRYLTLGRTLMDRGLEEKARQELEKAVRADPSFLEPHILLARLYLQGEEVTKAMAELDQALELDPHSKEAKLLQGIAYAARGEDSQAISVLEGLLKNSPKPLPEAYYQIGKIYQKQNKTSQALEMYRRALELLLEK